MNVVYQDLKAELFSKTNQSLWRGGKIVFNYFTNHCWRNFKLFLLLLIANFSPLKAFQLENSIFLASRNLKNRSFSSFINYFSATILFWIAILRECASKIISLAKLMNAKFWTISLDNWDSNGMRHLRFNYTFKTKDLVDSTEGWLKSCVTCIYATPWSPSKKSLLFSQDIKKPKFQRRLPNTPHSYLTKPSIKSIRN